MFRNIKHQLPVKYAEPYSIDPDLTASSDTVWSGPLLFAFMNSSPDYKHLSLVYYVLACGVPTN